MRSEQKLIVGVALILVTGGATCPKAVPDIDGARGQAIERALGQTHVNTLQCHAGDCQDWHRIRLPEPGVLFLNSRIVRSRDSHSHYALLLEDGFGDPLQNLRNVGTSGQKLVRALDAGVYLIGVEAPPGSAELVYEIRTRFEPDRLVSPPQGDFAPEVLPDEPPQPSFERVDAEVLEVEGRMAAPTGVLLDLGRNRGIVSGLLGELLEGDAMVGEIEVIDIYDEGSRARVFLPLTRPITPAVRAVLLLPASDEIKAASDEAYDSGATPGGDMDSGADSGSGSGSDIWATDQDAFQPYAD